MKRLRLIFFFAMLPFPVQTAFPQTTGYYPQGGPDNGSEVSLIQLIANPQLYDQKRIRLIGYLHLEFEGDAIYLHQEDFDLGIYENSIWINLPKDISSAQKKIVNDNYVICTARFVAGRHGHMGMFAGELEDVIRLELWPAAHGVPPPPAPPAKPSK